MGIIVGSLTSFTLALAILCTILHIIQGYQTNIADQIASLRLVIGTNKSHELSINTNFRRNDLPNLQENYEDSIFTNNTSVTNVSKFTNKF